MGKGQGVGACNWSDTDSIAMRVFKILAKLSDKSRLFECALAAYASSGSYADSAWKVQGLLANFHLSASQVDRVLEAYRGNGQNKYSFRGMELLRPLLKRWTGKEWTTKKNELTLPQTAELAQPRESEIPF